MTFEQIWESSRYNWAFWLSHCLGVFGLVLLPVISIRVKSKMKRRVGYAAVLVAMAMLITELTIQSVQVKWKTRWDAAQTEEQKHAVANRDGANLCFSPIIGGFKAIMYMGTGTIAVLIARKKRSSHNRLEATGDPLRGSPAPQP